MSSKNTVLLIAFALVLSGASAYSNSLCGVSIGDGLAVSDSLDALYTVKFEEIDGSDLVRKAWILDDGSELYVLWLIWNSPEMEVYAIIHTGTEVSQNSGFPGFTFFETNLTDIRERFGNNGFSYPGIAAQVGPDDELITTNMWFLNSERPREIIGFKTSESKEDWERRERTTEVDSQERIDMFAENHFLIEVLIVDAYYAGTISGEEKIFDEAYDGSPITWE